MASLSRRVVLAKSYIAGRAGDERSLCPNAAHAVAAAHAQACLISLTLVNVHLMEVETRTLGFPNSLDATTVGVRTDSGYRFGSFNGGAFIEPLATISVNWAEINGFSLGGNRVSFNASVFAKVDVTFGEDIDGVGGKASMRVAW